MVADGEPGPEVDDLRGESAPREDHERAHRGQEAGGEAGGDDQEIRLRGATRQVQRAMVRGPARGPDFAAIRKLTEECFMPLTVGGGVRSVEDVKGLLDAGADKVAIKTNIDVGYDAAKRYGSQALVAVMDELPPYHLCDDVACAWADLGYGEILLTSIEREGTMEGYDLELIHLVANVVDIPVIAHGGCSGYEDMYNAIQAGASAVAAGALFQFTDCTPRGAAEYLSSKGVEVRL